MRAQEMQKETEQYMVARKRAYAMPAKTKEQRIARDDAMKRANMIAHYSTFAIEEQWALEKAALTKELKNTLRAGCISIARRDIGLAPPETDRLDVWIEGLGLSIAAHACVDGRASNPNSIAAITVEGDDIILPDGRRYTAQKEYTRERRPYVSYSQRQMIHEMDRQAREEDEIFYRGRKAGYSDDEILDAMDDGRMDDSGNIIR